MPISFVRTSALERTKKRPTLKNKAPKLFIPEDVKPVLVLESSDELPPSILDYISFEDGMTNKQFWKKVTDQVKDLVDAEGLPRIPIIDYSYVLPPNLKERIRNIMGYDFSESDDLVYIRDEVPPKKDKELSENESIAEENAAKLVQLRNRGPTKSFHESTFSDIERMEDEYNFFNVVVDDPLRYVAQPVDHRTWLSQFLCNPDRVIWESRACVKENNIADKTLDEQAEQLMEMAAERFVEWLNGIGSQDEIINVQNLKDLFSIKGDRMILESFRSEPTEVNAIAKTVAEKWNKPEIALETKYVAIVNHRVKKVAPKKKMLSAFGRTISGPERPWYKSASDVPIETVYPEELMTRETIFNGIRHFRSVKALINFYLKHPRLPRPEYLVKNGDFKIGVDISADTDIPLYDKLGLKY